MLKWNDPDALHEIDIEGTKFFCKTLTTGQRLKMLDDLSAMQGTNADFDGLMRLLATYIQRIEVFTPEINLDPDGGDNQGTTDIIEDPASIERCIVFIDNIGHQNELLDKVMAVNRLRKAQIKN